MNGLVIIMCFTLFWLFQYVMAMIGLLQKTSNVFMVICYSRNINGPVSLRQWLMYMLCFVNLFFGKLYIKCYCKVHIYEIWCINLEVYQVDITSVYK